MNTPFWRCVIISLLLWALPTQWLAAASALSCPEGAGIHTTSAHSVEHPRGPTETRAHVHETLTVEHDDSEASPSHADAAPIHSHAQCATAGHCCFSAALLPAALPDFDGHTAATQFAPLAQAHPTPLLRGPDRPPQALLA